MTVRSACFRLAPLFSLVAILHCASAPGRVDDQSTDDVSGEADAGSADMDAGIDVDAGVADAAGTPDGGTVAEDPVVSFLTTWMTVLARKTTLSLEIELAKPTNVDVVAVLSVRGAGRDELSGVELDSDGRFEMTIRKGSKQSNSLFITSDLQNSAAQKLVFTIESVAQGDAQIAPTKKQLTVMFPSLSGLPILSITGGSTLSEANPTKLGGFTVRVNGRAIMPVTLTYTLTGTATRGADYNLAGSTTWTLDPGAILSGQTVTIIDDDVVEDSEAIVMTVTSVDGAELDVDTQPITFTILDNDSP